MWCLGRLLPMMISSYIPEQDVNWNNYLQLLHIMELVFSPSISSDLPPYVQVLVEEYLETFRELYPEHTIIPKMHYMVHLSRYLHRYGFFRNQCCNELFCTCAHDTCVHAALGLLYVAGQCDTKLNTSTLNTSRQQWETLLTYPCHLPCVTSVSNHTY